MLTTVFLISTLAGFFIARKLIRWRRRVVNRRCIVERLNHDGWAIGNRVLSPKEVAQISKMVRH